MTEKDASKTAWLGGRRHHFEPQMCDHHHTQVSLFNLSYNVYSIKCYISKATKISLEITQ